MKRFRNSLLSLILIGFVIFAEESKENFYAIYDLTTAKNVEVTTTSGNIIIGTVTGGRKMNEAYFLSLTIKDENNKKHKFKTDDIKKVVVKKFSKLGGNLIIPSRDIVYLNLKLADIKGKIKNELVQQLTYSLTDKIVFYSNPSEYKWKTIPFTGVKYLQAKGYYVSLHGDLPFEITEKYYQKKGGFKKVFGEYKSVMDNFSNDIDFDDINEHLDLFFRDYKK